MSVGPNDVKSVIENYVKAWQEEDKELLLSLFADNAIWQDPVGTPAFEGLEGVSKFWDFSHPGDGRTLNPVPHQIITCANEGVLRFTMQVRVSEKNQGLDLHVIDQFILDDQGKIKVAKAYWDENSVTCPEGMELFVPNVDAAHD